jgi:drug/metabolite transporter (DMT)-like permease
MWGLAAAVSFGVADFLARGAGQKEGSLKTLLYAQVCGIPLTVALVALAGPLNWSSLLSTSGLVALLASSLLTAGNAVLYRSLVKGPLLIVAPITSSFSVVTVILSLLSGEALLLTQMAGIVLTLTGIVVSTAATATPAEKERRPLREYLAAGASSGIALATGAALLLGIGIYLLKIAVVGLGSTFSMLVLRLAAVAILLLVHLLARRPARLRHRSSLRPLAAIGVLDGLASWFLTLGLFSGLASVVSVTISLYSVVTIILGRVILSERVTGRQRLGIGFTLAGVALVSI